MKAGSLSIFPDIVNFIIRSVSMNHPLLETEKPNG